MHPTIQYELTKARVADLHREARLNALARSARRARRQEPTRHPVPVRAPAGLAWRLFAALGARSL